MVMNKDRKGLKMKQDEIEQLTPDGYGGDFEMTAYCKNVINRLFLPAKM